MFEFRGAREAERSRAERGTAGMSVAERVQREIAQQQRDSDSDERARAAAAVVQQNLAAQAAAAAEAQAIREAEARMAAMPIPAPTIDPTSVRAQEAAFAGGLPMGPILAPAIDFGFGASLGQIAYPTAYQTFTPGQQASLNRYLEAGETGRGFGLGPAILGALGAPSMYDQLSSGDYRPVFVGDELYGAFGEGPFGGKVYTGRTLPYETAQEYGIPGYFPPEEGDDRPEITGTVTDPATGQEKCPDGYIFDEDLQACRLAPMERAAVDTTPGERYIRSGLLDVAPEGLMGFRERYGAGFGSPMDFAAANRAFRMGGAVTPSFYSAPPKLDGYTLLT